LERERSRLSAEGDLEIKNAELEVATLVGDNVVLVPDQPKETLKSFAEYPLAAFVRLSAFRKGPKMSCFPEGLYPTTSYSKRLNYHEK